MDGRLRQFTASFSALLRSKLIPEAVPHGPLASLLCLEAKILTGLLRQVAGRATLSGLSRFLAKGSPGPPPRSLTPGAPASTARSSRSSRPSTLANWLLPVSSVVAARPHPS